MGRSRSSRTRTTASALNSPNDVVVRSDGTIWFTDPDYGLRQNCPPGTPKEQDGDYVFRCDPATGELTGRRRRLRQTQRPGVLARRVDPLRRATPASSTGPGRNSHIRAFQVDERGTLRAVASLRHDRRASRTGCAWIATATSGRARALASTSTTPSGALLGRVPFPDDVTQPGLRRTRRSVAVRDRRPAVYRAADVAASARWRSGRLELCGTARRARPDSMCTLFQRRFVNASSRSRCHSGTGEDAPRCASAEECTMRIQAHAAGDRRKPGRSRGRVRRRRGGILGVTAAASAAIAADASAAPAASERYTIYLSAVTIGNDWLQQMLRSAQVAVDEGPAGRSRGPQGRDRSTARSRPRSTRSTTSSAPSRTRSSSMPTHRRRSTRPSSARATRASSSSATRPSPPSRVPTRSIPTGST